MVHVEEISIQKREKHGASGGNFLNLVSVVHIFLFLYKREELFFFIFGQQNCKGESMKRLNMKPLAVFCC